MNKMEKEVTVYIKTKCPFCAELIKILNERGIKYKLVDFIKNPEYVEKIITRDGNTPAPQVELNGRIIFDYATEEDLADEIEEYLKS